MRVIVMIFFTSLCWDYLSGDALPGGVTGIKNWDNNSWTAYERANSEVGKLLCGKGISLQAASSQIVSGTKYRFEFSLQPDLCDYGSGNGIIRLQKCEVAVWMSIVTKIMVITNNTCTMENKSSDSKDLVSQELNTNNIEIVEEPVYSEDEGFEEC